MTLFGKILVFIILAISVMMCMAAVTLYTNRIDWSDHPPKGQEPAGMLAERQAEVKELWDGIASAKKGETNSPYLSAENDWRATLKAVEQKEAQRPTHRDFYRKEIAHLLSGADAMNPAREVVIDKKTFVPVLDPQGLPQMAPAQDRDNTPLQSLKFYNDRRGERYTELQAAIKDYGELVKKDQELTDELIGVPPDRKGLHQRLVDERAKRVGVAEEHKVVKPQLINATVEGALIIKRSKQLKARIAELKKIPVAAQR